MKKNIIIKNITETSKIGFAGIIAGVFCIAFSVIYTLVCHLNRRE
jgi:hypothetical protein